jgi:hypothetical protein
MATKRRRLQRRKTAGPFGVLGDKGRTIPVHVNDVKGPIYAVALDPRGTAGPSKSRRGKTARTMKQKKDKPIIIIVVGRGGRCVKHEFDEVIYWVCGGTYS